MLVTLIASEVQILFKIIFQYFATALSEYLSSFFLCSESSMLIFFLNPREKNPPSDDSMDHLDPLQGLVNVP